MPRNLQALMSKVLRYSLALLLGVLPLAFSTAAVEHGFHLGSLVTHGYDLD
jgi:hypothetical protein